MLRLLGMLRLQIVHTDGLLLHGMDHLRVILRGVLLPQLYQLPLGRTGSEVRRWQVGAVAPLQLLLSRVVVEHHRRTDAALYFGLAVSALEVVVGPGVGGAVRGVVGEGGGARVVGGGVGSEVGTEGGEQVVFLQLVLLHTIIYSNYSPA
jgi:hypothetical protein